MKKKSIEELLESRERLNRSFSEWISGLPTSATSTTSGQHDIASVLAEERERVLTPEGVALVDEATQQKKKTQARSHKSGLPDPRREILDLKRRVSKLEHLIDKLTAKLNTPRTKQELEASVPSWKAWPDDQPKRYNGSGTPCDMWTGPCGCGAFHTKGK